jgi:hypothetical protein
VTVIHVPGEPGRDATIRFEIAADLVNGDGRQTARTRVKFETIIDAARNVRVQ